MTSFRFTIADLERFAKRFDIQPNGCWIWNRARHPQGYGQSFNKYTGSQLRAHRHAYLLIRGEVPEGLVLDHLCRNEPCVNPYHLEPVTQRENILRGIGISATNAKKTHCKRGHELSGDNVGVYGRGKGKERQCKTCALLRQRIMLRKKRIENVKAKGWAARYAYHQVKLAEELEEYGRVIT